MYQHSRGFKLENVSKNVIFNVTFLNGTEHHWNTDLWENLATVLTWEKVKSSAAVSWHFALLYWCCACGGVWHLVLVRLKRSDRKHDRCECFPPCGLLQIGIEDTQTFSRSVFVDSRWLGQHSPPATTFQGLPLAQWAVPTSRPLSLWSEAQRWMAR